MLLMLLMLLIGEVQIVDLRGTEKQVQLSTLFRRGVGGHDLCPTPTTPHPLHSRFTHRPYLISNIIFLIRG